MAKRKQTSNPLIEEARKLPRATRRTGTMSWYDKLRTENPAQWKLLCSLMDAWKSDKKPGGLQGAMPFPVDLYNFLGSNKEASGIRPYLPGTSQTFRRFCSEYEDIRCQN